MDYFSDVLTTFLIVVVALLSMEDQRAHGMPRTYLILRYYFGLTGLERHEGE